MFHFTRTETTEPVKKEMTVEEMRKEIFIMDGEKISDLAQTIFIDLVNDEENRSNLSPSDLAESAFDYAKAFVKVYNKFWDIRNKAVG